MTELDERFDRVAKAYETSQSGPVAPQKQRRRLYGLYKQATEGDARGPQPGFFNFEEQLKYREWKGRAGMDRREAKHRFVRLADQLGYRDPGEVPVPWISEQTWRREESWPAPDYDEPFPCVNDPRVVVVPPSLREMSPTVATAESVPMPPKKAEDEQLDRLRRAPDTLAFHLFSPKWPICCRRLTVLVGYRGVDADVADALPHTRRVDQQPDDFDWTANLEFDEPAPYEQETLRDGLLLFHCHDCGSVYLSSHEV